MELLDKAVQGGYCIGCGTCTSTANSPYQITMNDRGCFEASLKNISAEIDDNEQKVCPFYESQWNEDAIAQNLFSKTNSYYQQIGYFKQIYAGRVNDEKFVKRGSSGGLAKWLLQELLDSDLVDYVVQVYNNEDNPQKLFEYRIVSTPEQVALGSKSAYYPVEMSGVLEHIKNNPGSYAITGVPCFIKGIRLLQLNNQIFAERIKYCIGIICGHLKSKFYAEMIGWQLGVNPDELGYIDFRVKIAGKRANEKGVLVKSVNGFASEPEIVQNIFGTNYGHGFFKYNACDYCDDVIGETADISIGDAWLPEFLNSGNSILVTRNIEINNVIVTGLKNSKLSFEIIEPAKLIQSQAGGYRDRREGLVYRLGNKEKLKEWVPQKRITTNQITLDKTRINIYKKRQIIAKESYPLFQKAKEKNDFIAFQKSMKKHIIDYKALYSSKAKLFQFLGYFSKRL